MTDVVTPNKAVAPTGKTASPASLKKARAAVNEMFTMLSKGCGTVDCANVRCASMTNAGFAPRDLMRKAIELVKAKQPCCLSPPSRSATPAKQPAASTMPVAATTATVAATVAAPAVEENCASCAKALTSTTRLRCSRCKARYFCSQPCQRSDWKAGHKKNCEAAPAPAAAVTAAAAAAAAPSVPKPKAVQAISSVAQDNTDAAAISAAVDEAVDAVMADSEGTAAKNASGSSWLRSNPALAVGVGLVGLLSLGLFLRRGRR